MPSRPKKKPEKRFPRKILGIQNADKKLDERWTPYRDPMDLPCPYRCLVIGSPGTGKSTLVKNLIIRANPEFDEIYLLHCDSSGTKEYDDMDVEVLDEIPEPSDPLFNSKKKKLIILDDIPYKGLSKAQKSNLERMTGYLSSHKFCSIIMTAQDGYSVFPAARRNLNVWCFFRCYDMYAIKSLLTKSGINKKYHDIVVRHVRPDYNFFMVDRTKKTPYPIRLNGYTMLDEDTLQPVKSTETDSQEV